MALWLPFLLLLLYFVLRYSGMYGSWISNKAVRVENVSLDFLESLEEKAKPEGVKGSGQVPFDWNKMG